LDRFTSKPDQIRSLQKLLDQPDAVSVASARQMATLRTLDEALDCI
jgi:hypothetical protein